MSDRYSNVTLRARFERILLMQPFNAVGALRINGEIDSRALKSAVEKLRRRHALLAVRCAFDDQGVGFYKTADVGEMSVRTVEVTDDEGWLQVVADELRTAFPIRTGPLIRFVLVRSASHAHLLVTGHHAVCDGVSHMFLVRDILEQLAVPERDVEVLPPPPPTDVTTVRSPPQVGRAERWLQGLMNRRWAKQRVTFDQGDMERLHDAFWRKNGVPVVLAWDLPASETTVLLARSRKERVLVNSALWTAFLAAQYDVQGDAETFRNRVGIPISTRNKLSVPAGEAIGFYVSAVIAKLKYDPEAGFWEAARKVQRAIHQTIKSTNLFDILKSEMFDPTLLDALYFAKYGLITNRLPRLTLKGMLMDKVTHGFTMSYLDPGNFATEYGNVSMEALYGFVYSDFNEKVVAVIKLGGRLSFTLVCNAEGVGAATAERLRDSAMGHLRGAIG